MEFNLKFQALDEGTTSVEVAKLMELIAMELHWRLRQVLHLSA